MKSDIIKKIEKIIGKKNIVQSENDKKKYLTEWRNRYSGNAKAILKPKNVKEVSLLMKTFDKENIPVIPQGGNTGLVGGQISYNSEHFVISFERMNKVIKFNKEDQSIVVQSGTLLSDIQNICEENDMFFPLSLASEGSCTIGGNIATNAGGVAVLYYGNTRNLTLGLEIVLPDGTIIDSLKTLKKDNTGYSLKDLFIGSEGTLGLITAASLQVFFKPRDKYTFFCSVKNLKRSIELLRFLQKNISTPLTAFELMNSNSIETVLNHIEKTNFPLNKKSDWYILFEFSQFDDDMSTNDKLLKIISDSHKQKLISEVVFANSTKQTKELWALRENISEAQKEDGASIKNDISIPIFSIDNFIKNANEIVEKTIPKSINIIFGHVGDGNIHYNITQPKDMNKKKFLTLESQLKSQLLELIKKYNGSFSAEHGIGIVRKKDALKFKKDEIAVMKRIKKAIDPKNIINPGKIFD